VTANVRCAGGGWWEQPAGDWPDQRIRYRDSNDPCGWQGDPDAARTDSIHDEQFTRDDGTQHPVTVAEYRCPRCGGRVELVGLGGGSGYRPAPAHDEDEEHHWHVAAEEMDQ
jgi:hypothetical protein